MSIKQQLIEELKTTQELVTAGLACLKQPNSEQEFNQVRAELEIAIPELERLMWLVDNEVEQ